MRADQTRKPERRAGMENINCAVAICNSHSETEEAVRNLQKSGFDMKKFSIIGRN
jgi:hypothetical protein